MASNDYLGLIITALFLLLYFFSSSKKKKPSPHEEREEEHEYIEEKIEPIRKIPPPPQKRVQEKRETSQHMTSSYVAAHRDIESDHSNAYKNLYDNSISEPSFASAIGKGLSHQIDLDPAYKIKTEKKKSLGKIVLSKNHSLKDLMIIHEVLKRPYE